MGLIFKTHLDLGFTAPAREVFNRYMNDFMPRATRQTLDFEREFTLSGDKGDRFVWTTGSWLVTKYLEHAKGAALREFESALERGLIRWHALPFTFETEALDASLLQSALAISKRLDARFGVRTQAAKMTDVPGHTRGVIPAMAAAGIKLLHIGVNPASPMPDVPRLFRWRHPSGDEIIVCYDATYGGFCPVPGSDRVYAMAMTGDNAGPPAADTVHAIYADMREKFPAAEMDACTLEEMAEAVDAARDQLPVVTSEIGDTWIHGYGTDPWKMAAYRNLALLRKGWMEQGRLDPESRCGRRFDENLLLSMEHTWGLDEKTWLPDGEPLSKIEDCYARNEFVRARRRKAFRGMEASWDEQRDYIRQAVAALPEGPLRSEAEAALAELIPVRKLNREGLRPVSDAKAELSFSGHKLALGGDGALDLAGIAGAFLGRLRYQVYGGREYGRFMNQYVNECERYGFWAPFDFDKPGMERVLPAGRDWRPSVSRVLRAGKGSRIVFESGFPDEAVREFGAPRKIRTEVEVRPDGSLAFDLRWFDKPACRMAEALWFSFRLPVASDADWRLHKLGGDVDPCDVVSRGGRSLHIVHGGVSADDGSARWNVSSPDAALVAPGKAALLDFNDRLPNASEDGVHFNLHNNVWGTNFPMWYHDDARFRFVVRFTASGNT
jgi:hypothetical protein